jgi:hypothetical protein
MQCGCVILTSVACPALQYYSTFFHTRHDCRKSCWTKNVFWFSLQLFLILRRNERDIKNVFWFSCKVRFSTRSPLLPCLSRHTQSGRRSSFGKRVWFTESHIILVFFLVLFTNVILNIKKRRVVSSQKRIIFYWNNTVTLHHSAFVRNCVPHSTPASVIGCQPLLTFKILSVPPLLSITNGLWTYVTRLNP